MMLTCAGLRRLKTSSGIPANRSGRVSSFDIVKPSVVPTTNQIDALISACSAAESVFPVTSQIVRRPLGGAGAPKSRSIELSPLAEVVVCMLML
jgi:hypothetical protein